MTRRSPPARARRAPGVSPRDAAPADAAPVLIDSPARWEAVSSPVRMRILMVLEGGRTWRVRDLAAAISRTPQAIYRHLTILRDVGLIEEQDSVDGSLYRCPRPVEPFGFFAGEPFEDHYARAVDRIFREAARICARVSNRPELKLRRLTQAWSLRLSPTGVQALNAATARYFSEVRRLLRDEADAGGLPVYVVLGVALDTDDA